MTLRAVIAAMRPKSSGVSSNSPIGTSSLSNSTAQMIARPLFGSISARASCQAPGVRW
jgi:hypothetical protein